MVALFAAERPSMAVVVQPTSPGILHCAPVYPFVQIHEHTDPLDTLAPPFSQGVDCSHGEPEFCFGTATKKTGRRMAREIMIISTTHTVINSHKGIPQQRREQSFCWALSESAAEFRVSTLCSVDRRKNAGHDERSRGGGGNDASVSSKLDAREFR